MTDGIHDDKNSNIKRVLSVTLRRTSVPGIEPNCLRSLGESLVLLCYVFLRGPRYGLGLSLWAGL